MHFFPSMLRSALTSRTSRQMEPHASSENRPNFPLKFEFKTPRELRAKIQALSTNNTDAGHFAHAVQLLGKIGQNYLPTTEKSGSHNKDVYFRTRQEIETFQADHKQEHFENFTLFCDLLGIDVKNNENETTFEFKSAAAKMLILRSDKNLYKIISRMIESVSLIQGYEMGFQFAKFLCETFPEEGSSRDLRQGREFWKRAWAPHVIRHPLAERIARIEQHKPFRSLPTVRPAQEMYDLCSDFEKLDQIFKSAKANQEKWKGEARGRKDGTSAQQKADAPPVVAATQIGKTNIYLSPCTSVKAICSFTKATGDVYGVLNFANAFRVGGGVLGFGRVQEETLFHLTTMFGITLEELKRGEVLFAPENRDYGDFHTATHEGRFTQQLPYTPARTQSIRGEAESGYLIPDPSKLQEHYTSVVIKDDNGNELPQEEQTPFVVLTAALSDRCSANGKVSNTPEENRAAQLTNGTGEYLEHEREEVRGTLRAVLKTAKDAGLKDLILGAIGCGAFGHPPKEIAAIFHDLLEGEFKGAFENVVFAIPGMTSANFQAFKEEFTPTSPGINTGGEGTETEGEGVAKRWQDAATAFYPTTQLP